MAYSLGDRFPKLPKYYPILDPGHYETIKNVKSKLIKAPFLSTLPRVCQKSNQIWTHVIYNPKTSPKIPNCSSMKSKLPRFPYESFTKEDLDENLCQCDIRNKCECIPEEEELKHIKSVPPFRHQIFIGLTPRRTTDEGLSNPCKRDRGFKLFSDGSQKRIFDKVKVERPPFYDTTVHEMTTFYRGCKRSHRTARTNIKTLDSIMPGPTSYTIKQEITETCTEKIRANRRKNSKQFRFIEMVQQKNLKENLPGPATYNPKIQKGTELQILGSKAERFLSSKYNVIPGPGNYDVKRDFDLPKSQNKRCLAKLPERAIFGVKDSRFRPIIPKGPGPSSYKPNYKLCQHTYCPKAPFGSNSLRFIERQEDTESSDEENINLQSKDEECANTCLSWMFKSQTKRIKQLTKKLNDPSPADLSLKKLDTHKSSHFQAAVPFHTSITRFQPWYNWIPVNNMEYTPGPGSYRPEKSSCTPAVRRGPICRSERFKWITSQNPPCNAYKVGGGIEKVLHTHNEKLKDNIKKQHKFHWKGLRSKRKLSDKQRESLLLNRCINLLNTDIFSGKSFLTNKNITDSKTKREKKKKLLRTFLHQNTMPNYF